MLWNLSSALLVLFFIQIVCGLIAVYVKIPEFSYIRKTQWLYGFFRLTFLISLVMAVLAEHLAMMSNGHLNREHHKSQQHKKLKKSKHRMSDCFWVLI